MKVVPPNLRPFVTPSVRKVFINTVPEMEPHPKQPASSSSPSSSSTMTASSSSRKEDLAAEVARLKAENQALHSSCAMWQRRAEMHGQANLGLLKFARAMRDQMSQIARDRNDLEERCYSLKRALDGDCDYSDEWVFPIKLTHL
jgi:predicted RNase H-like nuclease (RuvC/YqgF family)